MYKTSVMLDGENNWRNVPGAALRRGSGPRLKSR